MFKTTLPLISMGVALTGASALTPSEGHAACSANVTSIPDPAPIDDNVAYGGAGDNLFQGGLPPIQTGRNRLTAQAASTNASPAAATATAFNDVTACTSEAFGAPLAAQGAHRTRASLDSTLRRVAQLRLQPRSTDSAPLNLYALGADQSRREGGDAASGTSALRVSRVDITVGADYRFNDQWTAGASLGLGRTRMRHFGDDAKVDGNSGNLTGYGSWSPSSASYVALAISTEKTRYTVRSTDAASSAQDRASGTSLGISLSAGYDLNLGAWTLSPYARADEIASRIGSFGDGAGSTTGRSGAISAGSQLQTSIPTSWGLIAPHARIEFTHITGWHLQGESGMSYAAGTGPLPTPNPWAIDRQYGQFGLGASAILQRGLTLFTDYNTGFAQKNVSSWRFTLGVRSEL